MTVASNHTANPSSEIITHSFSPGISPDKVAQVFFQFKSGYLSFLIIVQFQSCHAFLESVNV
jgi:hypothetical protein